MGILFGLWKFIELERFMTMVYGHSSDCSFGLLQCPKLWAYNVYQGGYSSFCRWDREGWESFLVCPLYRTSVSPWPGILFSWYSCAFMSHSM